MGRILFLVCLCVSALFVVAVAPSNATTIRDGSCSGSMFASGSYNVTSSLDVDCASVLAGTGSPGNPGTFTQQDTSYPYRARQSCSGHSTTMHAVDNGVNSPPLNFKTC